MTWICLDIGPPRRGCSTHTDRYELHLHRSGMKRSELNQRLRSLNVWKADGVRAPHKPLLLLWAFAECARGRPRMLPFAEADSSLRALLAEFGPARTTHHTEYPFWYLQSDGLWEVEASAAVVRTFREQGYPTKGALLTAGARGGLPAPLYAGLRRDARMLAEATQLLLDAILPASIQEGLLDALGLDLPRQPVQRDPAFRRRVLVAYEYRCAVCCFDARLGTTQVALEAAHIRWHNYGGPGVEQNGLALCSLHHKLFDLGGFTLSDRGTIAVSEHLHGTGNFNDLVLAHHRRAIRAPVNPAYAPDPAYVAWHREQVFRGPARP